MSGERKTEISWRVFTALAIVASELLVVLVFTLYYFKCILVSGPLLFSSSQINWLDFIILIDRWLSSSAHK
jgi:hypothetical protein